jgi:hypothetical protein
LGERERRQLVRGSERFAKQQLGGKRVDVLIDFCHEDFADSPLFISDLDTIAQARLPSTIVRRHASVIETDVDMTCTIWSFERVQSVHAESIALRPSGL